MKAVSIPDDAFVVEIRVIGQNGLFCDAAVNTIRRI